MRKILILFFMISGLVLGNSLSKINTLEARVSEKTFVNKSSREKVYKFQMKYPDKVYKEMISPKLNVGETYIYNGNSKKVYYPLLGQSFLESIDEDENYILQAIRAIKEGKKTYTLEKNEIKEFSLEQGITIKFLNYKRIDGLNFPTRVEIYENKRLISQLNFSDVKINKNINDNIFSLR